MIATKKDIQRLEREIKDLRERFAFKANDKMGIGEPLYGMSGLHYMHYVSLEEAIKAIVAHLGLELDVTAPRPAKLVLKKAK